MKGVVCVVNRMTYSLCIKRAWFPLFLVGKALRELSQLSDPHRRILSNIRYGAGFSLNVLHNTSIMDDD